jgi:putative ABC transport system substrate-binding protein
VRRRDVITLVSGAAASWPLGALAQQSGKIWRMGFIAHGHETFYDALFEGLQEFGHVEGQNLIVERRYAEAARSDFQNLPLRWFD